jgi:uncharacterized protein with PhoU and TrkA domain
MKNIVLALSAVLFESEDIALLTEAHIDDLLTSSDPYYRINS